MVTQIFVALSSTVKNEETIKVLEQLLESLKNEREKVAFLFGGPISTTGEVSEMEEFAKLALEKGYTLVAVLPQLPEKIRERVEEHIKKYQENYGNRLIVIDTGFPWGGRIDVLTRSSDIALIIGGTKGPFTGSMLELLDAYHGQDRIGGKERLILIYPVNNTTSKEVTKVLESGDYIKEGEYYYLDHRKRHKVKIVKTVEELVKEVKNYLG